MDVPKPGEITGEKNPKALGPAAADQADVHAMKHLMHRQGSTGELSALFSAQLDRRRSGEKKMSGRPPKDPETRGRIPYRPPYRPPYRDDGQKRQEQDDSSEDTQDLAQEVAEHILVSDPKFLEPCTQNQVRIKIRDSILKDAHVHLKKTSDLLEVQLMTTDLDSARILEASEPALQERLKKNFKGKIEINTIYLSRKETHDRS